MDLITKAWSAIRPISGFNGILRMARPIFGPKKKGGKGGGGPTETKKAAPAAPGADHLYNIFADREDPPLMEDSKYPEWLYRRKNVFQKVQILRVSTDAFFSNEILKLFLRWKWEGRKAYYGTLALKFVHGIGIEDATYPEYKRFLKKHRKMVIKTNNMRLAKTNRRQKFVHL